ncbi:hypothetical protein N7470_000488 [Penicillium chermesinum]|nr:hypothetical protein N7470_000488 [Penicillium chermesinum]
MQYSVDMIKKICGRVVEMLYDFGQLQESVRAEVSPLTLHCIYTCAATFAWLYAGTNDPQWAAGKVVCENQLRFLNSRWKVAGVYLEMLRISDLDDESSMGQ